MTSTGGLALSVVIPVVNAARDIGPCLDSINRQTSPPGGHEVVIADGGSTDETRAIAERAGARVVENEFRKAEPGVAVGMHAARGRLVTVMAADNRMRGTDFLVRMVEPFEDPDVVAALPRVVSTSEDGLVNRYVNRYSDPFNHFVYGSINTSIDLMLKAGRASQRPTVEHHPLFAIAQGCTVRAGSVYAGPPEQADDVMAIIELIHRGGKIVLVAGAELEHHHAGGLGPLYRKYSKRTAEALDGQQGFLRREAHISRDRRIRRWLWIPYSASLVAPAIHGAAMAARHRDPVLLYHPIVNTALFAAVVTGVASAIGRRRGRSAPLQEKIDV
ncbi:MAG TPA: glycosyltransferase [Candidatus Dormibacteraeota bacterium]|nr:glycosyltransferase [Candidatus Dormibacteraeota bacterium]